ncbi:histidine kinase dimerization/phospho-acceptor domain-containing protein [Marinobacter sp. TBZ242]|uniref:histidine kinase n=1 Tax=Marinobacter azerbaijanicus TaxID=3050455 RepID=A0ABT7IHY6_9GAMM|nr:ATP-binding protein [Marinobacter sp. TBZ242]MDL0433746.1 histidine kinase dimerization/phospho-acceptor domain-containing protein [Marinobacter sp. TBZ242]
MGIAWASQTPLIHQGELKRKTMSLRTRLLLTLGLTLTLLWGLAATWLLRDLHTQVELTLDKRLAQSARMVAGLMEQLPPEVWGRIDHDALTIPPIEGLACQIHSPRGEVIARSHAEMDDILAPGEQGYTYRKEAGTTWRVYTYERNGMIITTADRMDERDILLRDVIKVAVVPFLTALVGSMGALWLGVLRGLKPLGRLRNTLARRHPEALTTVSLEGAPSELRPLILTLNSLLLRVHKAMVREQRFTSDAAHELRTPLTAIKTHLQVARRVEGEAAERALSYAEEGVARMVRILEQLLLLARVEGRTAFEDGEACTLEDVISLAIQDAATHAETNRIDFSPVFSSAELEMPRELAVAALRNLIDNALRHGDLTEPVKVTVELQTHPSRSWATLKVSNYGAVLNDETLANLTERFWRSSRDGGSGLGLAIVVAIAERFEGALHFKRPVQGGLEASLILPVRPLSVTVR